MLTADEIATLTPEQLRMYNSLTPVGQERFAKSFRFNPAKAGSTGPQSMLLSIGVIGLFLSAATSVILLFSGNFPFGYLAAGACGTFAFMWIMGVIEERLIAIQQAIEANNAKSD